MRGRGRFFCETPDLFWEIEAGEYFKSIFECHPLTLDKIEQLSPNGSFDSLSIGGGPVAQVLLVRSH